MEKTWDISCQPSIETHSNIEHDLNFIEGKISGKESDIEVNPSSSTGGQYSGCFLIFRIAMAIAGHKGYRGFRKFREIVVGWPC